MPISNEIFETFRMQERVKEQLKAIRLLAKQGYTIIDSLNDRESIQSIKYNRVPKKYIKN